MLLWIPSENKSANAGNREYGTMYLGKGKYKLKDFSNMSYYIQILSYQIINRLFWWQMVLM